MNITLRAIQPTEGQAIFDMILEIDEGENGFVNSLKAKDRAEFDQLILKNYEYSQGIQLAKNHVPQTIYFLYINGYPVGYGKLRHYLNDLLKVHAGHVGYSIRPSERGKGYGSLILSEIIKKANEMNIEEVLLTCYEVNSTSRKVIEHNRGQLVETNNGKCKYIIRTWSRASEMITEPTLQAINERFQHHNINEKMVKIDKLSGTTAGIVYRLESELNIKYILKFDEPIQIQIVEQLLSTYQDSALLPKVLFVAQDQSYFVYTYISGTTHFNRGSKKLWLTLLVKELFNKYQNYQHSKIWGRLDYPLSSWREFNEISIEEAKLNVGQSLTTDDYLFVKSQLIKLFGEGVEQGERYLLHGDAGVHNCVFDQFSLIGIIDPSPMIGPIIYDFIYAFCSSPDDINVETLLSAFDNLEQGRIDKLRLIDEVSVQLYCRVGLCVKHHPNDLSEYLQAWEYWKDLCKSME